MAEFSRLYKGLLFFVLFYFVLLCRSYIQQYSLRTCVSHRNSCDNSDNGQFRLRQVNSVVEPLQTTEKWNKKAVVPSEKGFDEDNYFDSTVHNDIVRSDLNGDEEKELKEGFMEMTSYQRSSVAVSISPTSPTSPTSPSPRSITSPPKHTIQKGNRIDSTKVKETIERKPREEVGNEFFRHERNMKKRDPYNDVYENIRIKNSGQSPMIDSFNQSYSLYYYEDGSFTPSPSKKQPCI